MLKGCSLSNLLKNIRITTNVVQANFSTSSLLCRGEDKKQMIASLPKKDEGTQGEKTIDIDSLIDSDFQRFPDENTPNRLFGDVLFKDLPIVNIKATPNNTLLDLTDAKGLTQLRRSCGVEGFKNARKGTNIAAQATAISLGTRILDRGIKQIRVRVRGIGPGRMSAIKGLQMSGLNIISITDNTKVSWFPPRPRKAKRL